MNVDIEMQESDAAWRAWKAHWSLRGDTIYLNHGSFGPSPHAVRRAQQDWQDRLEVQPMDFYVRQLEPAWLEARRSLAEFVNTDPEDLVFAENSTVAMNILAVNFPLQHDDQVLLTDHEYGAVLRTWQRACRRAGAEDPVIVTLPRPLESADQIVDCIAAAVTERTRLVVISHVTSPTAIILPVKQVCQRLHEAGVQVCIDGPHAPVQVPLDIDGLVCDYYTASCHKWLCAPFGSGFFYVAPRHQGMIKPLTTSWGRLPPHPRDHWYDEFVWSGTRDPSAYLSVPAAIQFMRGVGVESFQARTHGLARYAREQLVTRFGTTPWVEDTSEWYGSMVNVPLPRRDHSHLQMELWQQYGIEVPVINFGGEWSIRVSCHLYNDSRDIDRLLAALVRLLT